MIKDFWEKNTVEFDITKNVSWDLLLSEKRNM